MPLDSYANLQASILSWLARPGDPLVSPSIPDIIQLFEHEATRRLKVGGAEKRASLTALSAAVALPADFGELRLATSGGVVLTYVTPMQLPDGGGPPAHYTIIGNEMRLGPSPSGGCTVEIVYQSGVPPLSDTNTTNWLLTAHPDCYLFGSLVEAESFIGSDERVPLWAQRREAAFASIETADRKARWGGAPLSIRAEGVSGGNGTAAGDWTSAPPVPIPIAGIVAGDGLTGGGTEGIVTVALDTPVSVSRGGTGAATAAAALIALGAAPLAGPVFTGDPQAPTPAPGDADTSIATTAFVGAALSAQALAGDVAGPTNNTSVLRLQGRPVAATAPTSLQVLQWSGTNWAPATIAAGGTLTGVTAGTGITVSGSAPSPTVALTVPVTVANGGTGSTTAGAALTALGAAPLNAPVFTGDARAVTPATADNDTSIATTAYVQAQGYATSAAMATADNLRVLKAGDTMTGNLVIAPASGTSGLVLQKPASGQISAIFGNTGASQRWEIDLGNSTAESGSNAGSNFTVLRYTDAGVGIDAPLTIIRSSGNVGVGIAAPLTTLHVGATTAADRFVRFSNSLNPTGLDVGVSGGGAGGYILTRDNSALDFGTNNATGRLTIAAAGDVAMSGFLTANGYSPRAGIGGTVRGNHYNIDWPGGSVAHLWIDAVDQGTITITCDYRIKENVALLSSTWDKVKGLRPVSYNLKDTPELLREADPAERWGFLAHELQETLLPTAATGEKDAPNVVQSPDIMALLASVTRALQEAMARIEALEGAAA